MISLLLREEAGTPVVTSADLAAQDHDNAIVWSDMSTDHDERYFLEWTLHRDGSRWYITGMRDFTGIVPRSFCIRPSPNDRMQTHEHKNPWHASSDTTIDKIYLSNIFLLTNLSVKLCVIITTWYA